MKFYFNFKIKNYINKKIKKKKKKDKYILL